MLKCCSMAVMYVAMLLVGCGSSSDSNGANSPLASTSDFCSKCAECIDAPNFNEGFCTAFKSTSGSFDRLKCNDKADTSQLKNQNVTVGELQAWTCAQFDDNE